MLTMKCKIKAFWQWKSGKHHGKIFLPQSQKITKSYIKGEKRPRHRHHKQGKETNSIHNLNTNYLHKILIDFDCHIQCSRIMKIMRDCSLSHNVNDNDMTIFFIVMGMCCTAKGPSGILMCMVLKTGI